MKCKIITGAVALLLAGCLLAGCETDRVTESEEDSAASSTVSSVSSEETVAEMTSSEASSEETGSEESSEPSESSETSAPLPELGNDPPEDLLVDSPAPPEGPRVYLPSAGRLSKSEYDDFLCTFSYEGNTLTVEKTYEDGRWERDEYRFDGHGRLLEHRSRSWIHEYDSEYRYTYTYDAEGHMTRYATANETNELVDYVNYFYDEHGGLCRKEYSPPNPSIRIFEHTYDENGVVTQLTESFENGAVEEHFYENGREVLSRRSDASGKVDTITAYDYNENGLLTRARYRSFDYFYAVESFYEEGRLIGVRRNNGYELLTLERYVYDAYGRPVAAVRGDQCNILSYGENGMLCKLTAYVIYENGDRHVWRQIEVTAWEAEAVTETQLAFYRVAMYHLFGVMNTGMDPFYDVQLPEP